MMHFWSWIPDQLKQTKSLPKIIEFEVLKLQRLTFTINALSLKLFLSNILPSNVRTDTTVVFSNMHFSTFCFNYKVQEFGLQEAYAHDRGTHSYVKQLMALPFLPAEKIETRFYRLQRRATTDSLKKFVQYVADNWIKSEIFPPTTWSVFMEAVRTNNDLEGWHNALNRRAKGKTHLPLYCLIQLLNKEASLVALQVRLVSDQKLRRHQRVTYKKMQKKLFCLWNEYHNGERNSKQLLEACAHLVNPV